MSVINNVPGERQCVNKHKPTQALGIDHRCAKKTCSNRMGVDILKWVELK